MVRALLEGRKTQTRRILKGSTEFKGPYNPAYLEAHRNAPGWASICPYGKPGDRLWVRETFFAYATKVYSDAGMSESAPKAVYKADGGYLLNGGKWKPSIFMPRWASRITLEVTEVRVQRLLDISEEDAIAEGLSCVTKDGTLYKYGIPDRDGLPGTDDDGWPWQEWDIDPRIAYFKLWNKINGEGAAARNPWVWAVSLPEVQP
jgi:hypothetical protein